MQDSQQQHKKGPIYRRRKKKFSDVKNSSDRATFYWGESTLTTRSNSHGSDISLLILFSIIFEKQFQNEYFFLFDKILNLFDILANILEILMGESTPLLHGSDISSNILEILS